MKRTKSIFAVILALTLVFASGIVAFAAGEGKITIDNAVIDQTYSIYRIFDIASHADDYSGVIYKVSTKWTDFFKAGAAGLNYVDVNSENVVTWKDGADAAAFAADAYAFAAAKGIKEDDKAKATTGTVEFSNLELGYYLVHSTLNSVCSLDTTTPSVTIKEKNSKSVLDKEVQEDSTGDFGKTDDADIGDTVNFKITVKVIDGDPKNYVIHDKMSSGLTYKEVSSVKVNGVALAADSYTVTPACEDDCTFEVAINNGVLNPNDVIVVEYSATVNENAVIGETGNDNDAKLTYGDKYETEWSKTRTYIWKFDILKYTMNGAEELTLAGAQFRLYKEVDGKKLYAVIANGKLTGWTEDDTLATVLETADDGKLVITGLDADDYKLEEIKAPDGYNKLTAPVDVKITATIDGATNVGTETVKYSYAGSAESTGTVKVLNNKGSELPSTGGIGTTIFYIVGAVLVAAAGILLITKKRMSKAAD